VGLVQGLPHHGWTADVILRRSRVAMLVEKVIEQSGFHFNKPPKPVKLDLTFFDRDTSQRIPSLLGQR
jgi:hypothetical protein